MLYIFTFALFFVSIFTQSKELCALTAFVFGTAYFVLEYVNRDRERLTIAAVYALSGGIRFGFGNLALCYYEGTIYEARFVSYGDPSFFFEAQVLATLGLIIPVLAMDLLARFHVSIKLPPIGSRMTDRMIFQMSLFFVVFNMLLNVFYMQFSLVPARVMDYCRIFSSASIFVLVMRRLDTRLPPPFWPMWVPFIYMIEEVSSAFLTSFMRSRIVTPYILFILPFLINKKLSARGWGLQIVVVLMLGIVVGSLDTLRTVKGVDRVYLTAQRISKSFGGDGSFFGPEEVWANAEDERSREDLLGVEIEEEIKAYAEVPPHISILARISVLAQLSRIFTLVDANGFYSGESLSYFTYAFVPRIIWPDKPMISPGQWYARQLGRGSEKEEGRFSNSIDMTVPGELYLNFGWQGIIIGLSFYGLLFHVLYSSNADWDSRNYFVTLYQLILFKQAVENGSHFGGSVFNIVSMYIFCLVFGMIFRGVTEL